MRRARYQSASVLRYYFKGSSVFVCSAVPMQNEMMSTSKNEDWLICPPHQPGFVARNAAYIKGLLES